MNIFKIFTTSLEQPMYLNQIYRLRGDQEYKRIMLAPRKLKGCFAFEFLTAGVFVLFSPVFFLFKFIKSLRYIRYSKGVQVQNDSCFLCFLNSALPRVVNDAHVLRDDVIWICQKDCPNHKASLSFYSLLNRIDYFKTYIFSVISYFYAVKKGGLRVAFLASNSFEWHLRYFACNHIPVTSELIFCNHMDSYAVLIDSLPHKIKTLIQHGTMQIVFNPAKIQPPYYNYNQEYDFWTYNLPHKYTTLSFVYSFTEKEYEALCMSIISTRPEHQNVGYALRISEREDDKFSVLIVGYYSNYAEIEEEIIKALQNLDINLYLKNHPTQPEYWYKELRQRYTFTFIHSDFFPKADLVLSYESTLALQYGSMGTRVLYYNDLKITELREIVKRMM